MARKTKYSKKFSKELSEGMRLQGWSIEECCYVWGISRRTYYNWLDEYSSFQEAHEIGERDYKIYWHRDYRDNMDRPAAEKKFAAANILGWTDKKEVKKTSEDRIQTITINVIEPPKRVLEHQETVNNVIDVTDYETVRNKPDSASS